MIHCKRSTSRLTKQWSTPAAVQDKHLFGTWGLNQLPEMSSYVLRFECPVEIGACRWFFERSEAMTCEKTSS